MTLDGPPDGAAGLRIARRPRPMRRVAAGELTIGYDEHGEGPPLVLLHGATSSGREDWAAQVPLLARSFRVLLPDARGHATSPWEVARGWSGELLVRDLEAFLDALGIATVHLAGFSMGAHTALGFAIRAPERVASLVLAGISIAPEPRRSILRRLLDPDRAERDDPARAALLAARHDEHGGAGAWRRLLGAIAVDLGSERLVTPRELAGVGAPALVAVGDRDPFVPVGDAWELARLLRRGSLLVLPDCPHELTVRRTGLFNEALGGFYRGILSA